MVKGPDGHACGIGYSFAEKFFDAGLGCWTALAVHYFAPQREVPFASIRTAHCQKLV
jgi:hypothetical protein